MLLEFQGLVNAHPIQVIVNRAVGVILFGLALRDLMDAGGRSDG